jgi:hypothetical protein
MSEYTLADREVDQVEIHMGSSIDDLQATFAVMSRTVEEIEEDCRSIAETLESLGDAMNMFSGAAGQDLGGFGAIGLPLMGAVKMVKSVAGQYVDQQTGRPLSDWRDFVASSSRQFEEYLGQLHTVAAMAERDQAGLDPEQLVEDRSVLIETKWKTQAWKQLLKRVAQLGEVVDGVLRVTLPGAEDGPAPDVAHEGRSPATGLSSGLSSALSSGLQRRVKDVQTRTTEKTDDMRRWVLQPFVALRDRAVRLPGQTERLAHEVGLLEVLIELQVAELDVSIGAVPAVQARMTRLRVAANVLLPELALQLAQARRSVAEFDGYIDRLDAGHAAGAVADDVHALLCAEYREGETRARATLAALEGQADLWRREGPAVIAACDAWMKLELAVVAARRYVQQPEASAGSDAVLRRERERLDEVAALMERL